MREGERGRKGEDRGKGKREREPLFMFSAHFFRSITFYMCWCLHGRRKGGTGNASCPPVEKLAGQVSPRNDISKTFFLDAL